MSVICKPLACLCAAIMITGVCLPAAVGADADQLLKRAAGDKKPVDDAVTLDEAMQAERHAELQLTVGTIRLGVLKAKTRLARHQPQSALLIAERSLQAVDLLPETLDREALAKPLHDIIAKARQQLEAAKSGSNKPAPPTGETRAARAQPEDIAPGPAAQLNDMGAREMAPIQGKTSKPMRTNLQRLAFRPKRKLDADARANVDDALVRLAGTPNDITERIMIYPADWASRTAQRSRDDDGIIFETPEFRDENGDLRKTVVYDVGALTHAAPYFHDAPQLDLAVITRSLADREALRYRSQIFNGYAEDVAAGIPLLPYFGGYEESTIDDRAAQENAKHDLIGIIGDVIRAE